MDLILGQTSKIILIVNKYTQQHIICIVLLMKIVS